jgi:hypothetical protein
MLSCYIGERQGVLVVFLLLITTCGIGGALYEEYRKHERWYQCEVGYEAEHYVGNVWVDGEREDFGDLECGGMREEPQYHFRYVGAYEELYEEGEYTFYSEYQVYRAQFASRVDAFGAEGEPETGPCQCTM